MKDAFSPCKFIISGLIVLLTHGLFQAALGQTLTIQQPTAIYCPGEITTITATTSPMADSVHWNVSNGTIVAGQGTHTIDVLAGTNPGNNPMACGSNAVTMQVGAVGYYNNPNLNPTFYNPINVCVAGLTPRTVFGPGSLYIGVSDTFSVCRRVGSAVHHSLGFVKVVVDSCAGQVLSEKYLSLLPISEHSGFCSEWGEGIVVWNSYGWQELGFVMQNTLPPNFCSDTSFRMIYIQPDSLTRPPGIDTLLNPGDTLAFTLPNVYSNPVWSDGSTTDTFRITCPGLYPFTALYHNCPVEDTIRVTSGQFPGIVSTSTSVCQLPLTLEIPNLINPLWSTGATQDSIVVTQPGNYSVSGSDSVGCPINASFLVPPTFDSTTIQTTPSCTGVPMGTVTFGPVGGTPPYSFSLDGQPPVVSLYFDSLASGAHTYVATDQNGCQVSGNFTIGLNALSMNVQADSIVCANTTALVSCTGINGNPYYTYSLNNGPFTFNSQFNVLAGSSYQIEVRDAHGCIYQHNGVLLADTVEATFRLYQPCQSSIGQVEMIVGNGIPPFQYSMGTGPLQSGNTFPVNAQQTYFFTVEDSLGCTLSETIVVGAPMSMLADSAFICAGDSVTFTASPYPNASIVWNAQHSGNVFTTSQPGLHTVEIEDGSSGSICLDSVYLEVNDLQVQPSILTPVCGGANTGILHFNASNGTPPYNYFLQQQPVADTVTSLGAGTYLISVTDATGCQVLDTIVMTSVPSPQATLTLTHSTGNDGIIDATATAGMAPYEYSLDGVVYQSSGTFSGLAPGFYTVYVRDANGCQSQTLVEIFSINTLAEPLESIRIFPNPTSGLLKIDFTGESVDRVIVWSLDGKQILERKVEPGTDRMELDLRGVAMGSVLLEVWSGERVLRRMVEKLGE